MTLAPPRLPWPEADQRTLRQPPIPGMTVPASGLAATAAKSMFQQRSPGDMHGLTGRRSGPLVPELHELRTRQTLLADSLEKVRGLQS